MKTLSFALLLVACMAFVMLGCSDNSAQILAPNEQAISSPGSAVGLAKANPIVNTATGAANDFFEGKAQTWAFTAHSYADNTYTGEYQIFVHSQGPVYGKIHGKVMSLKVYDYKGGKAAVIGAIETKSAFLPCYDVFVVIDNGEGAKAVPDMYTTYIYWTDDLTRAQEVWGMPPDGVIQSIINDIHPELKDTDILLPIRMGNVQVR